MYRLNHMLANMRYLLGVLLRKPLFFLRLLRNYATLPFRPAKPMLRFADIAITYKCTMHCEHCSALHMERSDKAPMTVDDFRLVARKLLRAGALVFNFTGGEPLLRKDLPEIIRAFKPGRALIAVQTNASLLEHIPVLSSLFSDSNPVALAFACAIDTLQIALRKKSSNMQVIAQKI